ncbi:MAG: heme-binding domain-containing protein [Anaerolineae bacterium]|nr:heme-binding domain-containing protein [Anaerolineae bacterium]
MQLVPVARTNPPAQGAVQWDSPQTEALAKRACLDCHSNQTEWPWYASVAPASWLLASHVTTARARLNLSELATLPAFRKSQIPSSMAMRIRNGTMPPSDYLMMHPQARLSDAEKQQLIQGLQASLSR